MFKFIYKFFHKHYHHHYHGVYKNPKKLFIFDLFLLAGALLMLGASLFFFFWKPGTTDLIDLKISLGDTRIKSGEAVRVSVAYTNRSKFELVRPNLAVHLPDGFIVDRTKTPETTFTNNSIVPLNSIEPGAKGQAEIYGTLFAEPKTDERILATLSYQAGPEGDTEQKLSSFFITLPESVLESSLTVASTTFGNQELAFTYTLKNTGSATLTDIGLEDTWEKPLIPANDRKGLSLASGETKTISGTFTAPAKAGDYTIVIRSHIIANNQSIVQSTEQKTLSVVTPDIRTEIKTLKEFAYAEPGQEIPVTVSFKNNSTLTLKGLRIKLTPTPAIIDLTKTARENQLKVEAGSLIIDSNRRTTLGSASPGSSDSLDLKLYLLPSFRNAQNTPSLSITPSAEGNSELITTQKFGASGSPLAFALATDLTLQREARYFTAEGDQLGRGPLPPEVGESTKYWVFLELFNTINAVQNASLAISLAPGATFTGKQSVTLGMPLAASGQNLSWKLNEIPANTKTGWYFEVETTPTAGQVGKNLDLVSGTSFTATDSVVGKEFKLNSGTITNILKTDDRGSRSSSKVIQP